MDSVSTIDYILKTKCSVSRFGDGEFYIMSGKFNGFQKEDPMLAVRLKEVMQHPLPNFLNCIPISLKDISALTLNSKLFALGFCNSSLSQAVIPFVETSYTYGDSLFTRFYMSQRNKTKVSESISKLKKLWENEDVIFVEGKYSRLGVGNDLFDNTRSIKRILCPNQNAFSKYDIILNDIIQRYSGELIIIALGMTATVLAYDLNKQGIRSLDLGHIDTEYEWFKMGTREKVSIPHKQVSEVVGGNCSDEVVDACYLSQVIDKII